jgi:hypothetical protein
MSHDLTRRRSLVPPALLGARNRPRPASSLAARLAARAGAGPTPGQLDAAGSPGDAACGGASGYDALGWGPSVTARRTSPGRRGHASLTIMAMFRAEKVATALR